MYDNPLKDDALALALTLALCGGVLLQAILGGACAPC